MAGNEDKYGNSGRAPQRISWKDANYASTGNAVSKSSIAPRQNWSNKAGKMVGVGGIKAGKPGGKGSVVQPKNTYKYGKLSGPGTPDAREARKKIGYKDYTPGAGSGSDEMTMEDLLASLLGGSGGGGGGSARAYSDEQIAATSAKLQAIYNRYAQDVAAREADIASQYEKTGTNLGGIYDTAVGNINSAYDAARAAQTQQLLNLGMTEQTPVQSFGNQTGATTSLQNLRAAVLAQNEATRNAAITNQRLASEAAQREGAQAAAQAAQQMASEMVSTGGGGGGSAGLSPYQYASLLMQNQRNEDTKAYNAARLAASAPQQRAPIDVNALIQQNIAGGMKPNDAIAAANVQAKYMP